MPSKLLKKLNLSDLDAIFAIVSQYPELHWSRASLAQSLEQKNTLAVGLYDDLSTLVCVALLNVVLDEAELLLIATDRQHLKQGYAESLLNQQHFSKIFLEVRQSNLAAQKLYAKLGFKISGRRQQYYKEGEDAILYVKKI